MKFIKENILLIKKIFVAMKIAQFYKKFIVYS